MSHPSSPNNRGSIFGWAKNLKKNHFLSNESVNEISDSESLGKSPTKSMWLNTNTNGHNSSQPQNIPFPQGSSSFSLFNNHPLSPPPSTTQHQQQSSSINNYLSTSPNSGSDFLRPLLNPRSRSANNVSRVRSNSLNQSESNSVRQHRDSFLQSNSLFDENSKYFGVPLQQALNEASAKISILATEQADGLNYGEIPVVVAKCGVYLKKNGLTVEGLFRVGGSSKRIKELQIIFNSPPNYGKKLNWDGFTVHDAASVLRRYLNALPEPLIPLDMYELFREPLRSRKRIISYMKYKAENPIKSLASKDTAGVVATSNSSVSRPSLPQNGENPTNNNNNNNNNSTSDLLDSSQLLTEANVGRLNGDNTPRKNSEGSSNVFSQTPQVQLSEEEVNIRNKKKSKNYKKLTNEIHCAIDEYKLLVTSLPVASKQLLFYILDLLAMVQNHSKENLMSSRNLAAIFQPSILFHPNHDLDPVEYALSQSVVEFLIQYAYKLLPNHEATIISPEASSPTTKSAMATHLSTNIPDFAPAESDVTSTSTSPLGEEAHLTKDVYPHTTTDTSSSAAVAAAAAVVVAPPTTTLPPPQDRQSSLGSGSNHDDLVSGYQHNVTGSLPFDSDMESDDIGSDLDDDLHFQQLKLNEVSPVKKALSPPLPSAIVVSTPSSLSVPQVQYKAQD